MFYTSLCVFYSQETPYRPPQSTGSTVCVAVTRGNQVIVGNVGDSHCVASRNGQVYDFFPVKCLTIPTVSFS